MPLEHVELVMFDTAGTTVDDRLSGPSLVVTAFVEAFAGAGFVIVPEQVHQHRGKEKREAIRSLLGELGYSDDQQLTEQAAAIYSDFARLRAGVDSLREMQGTRRFSVFSEDVASASALEVDSRRKAHARPSNRTGKGLQTRPTATNDSATCFKILDGLVCSRLVPLYLLVGF